MSAPIATQPDSRAATVVVAASNSRDKSLAKYVCDGSKDQVQIQQAIDEARGVGGEVVLLAGTYKIDGTIVLAGGYVKLCGESLYAYIKLEDGSNCNMIQIGAPGVTTPYTEICNLILDGNKAGQTATCHGIETFGAVNSCTMVRIKDVQVKGAHDEGFYIKNSVRAFVGSGVCGMECGADGFYSAAGATILHHGACNFNDRFGYYFNAKSVWTHRLEAVANGWDGICGAAASGVVLLSPLLLGNGQAAANTYDGIYIHSHRDWLIIGGFFCQATGYPDTQRYGIYIDSGADRTRVVGNLIQDMLTGDVYDGGTNTQRDLATGVLRSDLPIPRIRSGTAAGRPASGEWAGAIYFATDTYVLSIWDGAAWRTVALT